MNGLQRYFNVRREEIGPITAAALYFFCILTSLMILRPTRDALGMQRGIDEIRWLFMVTLVATLVVNPLFSWLVSRYRRMVFITTTHAVFALNLVLFASLLILAPQAIGERTGQVFYVWSSVFNFFITMVFWALMADRFTLEQSKRLFGLIAVGGTAGAMAGSSLASLLAKVVGAPMLLVIAAGFLVLATFAAWMVAKLQPELAKANPGEAAAKAADDSTLIGGSAWEGFRAVSRSPYLLGIAAYVLILAVMVTFIYFTRLQMVDALGKDVDMHRHIRADRSRHAGRHLPAATRGRGSPDEACGRAHHARAAAHHSGPRFCRARAGGFAVRARGLRRHVPGRATRDHAPGPRDVVHRRQ